MAGQIRILTGILILQLALTGWLTLRDQSLEAYVAEGELVSIPFEEFDAIVVSGSEDGEKVNLVKKEGKWTLPDYHGAPVAESKLSELDEKLVSAKLPLPVGRTEVALKQFSVTEDKFERKVVLKQGDSDKATVYLGTSPGFRKVHVRTSDNMLVYPIEYSTYSLPVQVKDWVDKNMFELEREKLTTVRIQDVVLSKKDNAWDVSGRAENESTNDSEVQKVLGTVSRVPFTEVIGTKDDKKFTQLPTVITIAVEREGASSLEYSVRGPVPSDQATAESDDDPASQSPKEYVFFSSAKPFVVQVDQSYVDKLKEVSRDKLLTVKEVAEAEPENKELEAQPEGDAPS